ncbi:Uncharacterized protein FWK35_00030437 [Aphis craccivora]|uniref:Uncharacterized protein n=1 Tax=Aphis craccivora TaxID=307492 RepID=A0A6G0VRE4_APHCR|nr:Uncharacterized protein FWK35_00030437 [Aphis craccivora]
MQVPKSFIDRTLTHKVVKNPIRPELLDKQQYSNVSTDDIELINYSFESELAQWALLNNITHTALNGVLTILKKHEYARTLLKTKSVKCKSIKEVHPDSTSNDEIKLVVGIGLPISKSSSTQFWLILGYIRSISNHLFPIGVYCGTQKSIDSNEYLKDFVTESEQLILNGIYINGNNIMDFIRVHVAKLKGNILKTGCAFLILNHLKGHIMIIHHVFPNNSCLVEIPRFDIVKGFSLDYMHLVYLGVGPLNVRLPSLKINQLSELIVNLKPVFVCEFSRKPRTLVKVALLSDQCYKNFKALCIAMTILLTPGLSEFAQYSRALLEYETNCCVPISESNPSVI